MTIPEKHTPQSKESSRRSLTNHFAGMVYYPAIFFPHLCQNSFDYGIVFDIISVIKFNYQNFLEL